MPAGLPGSPAYGHPRSRDASRAQCPPPTCSRSCQSRSRKLSPLIPPWGFGCGPAVLAALAGPLSSRLKLDRVAASRADCERPITLHAPRPPLPPPVTAVLALLDIESG